MAPRGSAKEYLDANPLFSLDSNGILVTDYGERYDDAGEQYNATFIATYILALHQDYLENGLDATRRALLRQADFLIATRVSRLIDRQDVWVWPYYFPNEKFQAPAGWISALAQGRLLVAFLTAYEVSGDSAYLCAAEKALAAFRFPMSAGGITTFDGAAAWFEEVAHEDIESTKILNGHMSAVAALWAFTRWTGDRDSQLLLEQGIEAVRRDIGSFDAGVLSYYSALPDTPRLYAPLSGYHFLHIHQLAWLASLSGAREFLDYGLRFSRYGDPGWQLSVSSSDKPAEHGPDQLRFQMGRKYWSTSTLPASITLDMQAAYEIYGATITGYIKKGAPRDFTVESSIDMGKWELLAEVAGNELQNPTVTFPPHEARYIRVSLSRPVDESTIILSGIGVLRDDGNVTAISDHRNYSSGTNRPPNILREQGWKMPHPGWIVLDALRPANLALRFSGTRALEMTISGSNDLANFTNLPYEQSSAAGQLLFHVENSEYRYLKIDIPKSVPRILWASLVSR